jgi:hypothetical protein
VSSPQAVKNSQESLQNARRQRPCLVSLPAPAAAICASAVGAFAIRAGPISRRAPQKPRSFRLQLLGFQADVEVAIGYRVMKRSETTAVEPFEVAGEPVMAERFQRGPRRAARHSTAASENAGVGSERAPGSKGSVRKGRWGLAPLSGQDEDDDEQRGDRRNTPKNLHLITPVPRQPSSEELDPSCR